jgi:hypothetical protein
MKLGDLKYLAYCVEELFADSAGELSAGFLDTELDVEQHSDLLIAEACAQQLIGTTAESWFPAGSIDSAARMAYADELQMDALHLMVCGEESAKRKMMEHLGRRGEALDKFLGEAFDGELSFTLAGISNDCRDYPA